MIIVNTTIRSILSDTDILNLDWTFMKTAQEIRTEITEAFPAE
jgi:hypothetical protein